MMLRPTYLTAIAFAAAAATAATASAQALTGTQAFGDWRTDAPGVSRKITPADLPPPLASRAKAAFSVVVDRPADADLKTPPGFAVQPFAKLDGPRLIRVAPNGDIFVAETRKGRIRILRARDGEAKPDQVGVFVSGLDQPFGIAFYPQTDPQWVYIANTDSVVRFPYRAGDLQARGPAQTIVPKLVQARTGHSTRDLAFSADGRRLFISVGSGSNVSEEVVKKSPEEIKAWAQSHAMGADWGQEDGRADVLVADPDGKNLKVYATGIRNCVGLALQADRGDLWCAVNERDMLGDDLPPDYVTRVKAGAFYGWPWFYIGSHPDPRPNVKDQRPDLSDKVTTPDILIQPHSAPLEMLFYPASGGLSAFPAAYRGDGFVALHGSWNRGDRTGYKVVRLKMAQGVPTGAYEDFLTGFVIDEHKVWGRPVGVAVARDGALLVSDDGNDTLWRVSYSAKPH